MTHKPYSDYKLEDFVGDPSFRTWVKKQPIGQYPFWQQWILENPGKLALVEQARCIVQQLSEDADSPAVDELSILWSCIRLDINNA